MPPRAAMVSSSLLTEVKCCLISTAFVGVAALTTALVEPVRTGIPFALFFAAIGLSSWLCGSKWAFWTIALSLLFTDLVLFAAPWTLSVNHTNLLRIAFLFAVAFTLNHLIAELKKSRTILEKERETLRTTLLSIGDGVIATDAQGCVWFMNRVAEELTGWKSNEAIGRPLSDVFWIIDESTRTPAENPIQKVLAQNAIVGFANHTVVMSKHNVETPIEDSAAPIRTPLSNAVVGVVVVFHDVTEKRRAERALRQAHDELEWRVLERTAELKRSEEKVRLLVESIVDYAIYMLDANGYISSWNTGAEHIKGYREKEIGGKHFSTCFTKEDIAAGKPDRLLAEARQTGRVESEGWRVRKDGSRFWCNSIITALRDSTGKVLGFAKVCRDLTEKRHAEETRQRLFQAQVAREQAEQAEQKILSVLNSITDGYISFEPNWTITFVNPQAEHSLGIPAQDLLGKNYWKQFSATLGTAIEAGYKRAANERVPVEFEDYYAPHSRWYLFKVYPTTEGVAVFFRDIHQQKHAEAALRAESERLRVTLISIGDAVIVTDTAARVTMLNPVAERLTGWTTADALFHPLDEVFNIVNEYTRAKADHPAKRALREGTVVGLANHTILISRSGSESPIDDSAAPIKDEQGHILGVVLVFRDITEKKKDDAERAAVLKREQEARQLAEHANRLKDEFLAMVSHELRTPLTPILGWTRILKSSNLTQENLQKGLEVIERNVAIQTKVIEDLLDVSRIISGKLYLNFKPVELGTVIEQAVETLRPAAHGKRISIEVASESPRILVNGDAARLQQVIWNLLGNAVKFTPEGGQIQVSVSDSESYAEVVIADSGEGIDPQFLPSLFARFSQADSSTARIHGGLGLGLAIVKHVVEAHGGSISGSSLGKGCGATFKIRIPILPMKWPLDSVIDATPTAPPASIAGLAVLVIDDDADARDLIVAALREAGAKGLAASSAADALALFARTHIDVLISDVGMPYEDGYTLMRKVRQLPKEKGGEVPAIALTAFAKPADQVAAIMAGFQAHLSKPMDPAELIRLVAAITNRR